MYSLIYIKQSVAFGYTLQAISKDLKRGPASNVKTVKLSGRFNRNR
jgi:hypothetical protein